MIRRLILGGVGLILAACTSQAPTATVTSAPQGPTSQPPAPPTLVVVTRDPLAQSTQAGGVPIPIPGTLAASETEDPNADVPFTSIQVVRAHLGVVDRLIIQGDGTFTYNDVPGVLSPQQIASLNQAIKAINFYGLQGTMQSTVPQNNVYEYAVTIVRGDDSRTLVSHDIYMPREYTEFVAKLWSTRDSLTVVPTSQPPLTQAF